MLGIHFDIFVAVRAFDAVFPDLMAVDHALMNEGAGGGAGKETLVTAFVVSIPLFQQGDRV